MLFLCLAVIGIGITGAAPTPKSQKGIDNEINIELFESEDQQKEAQSNDVLIKIDNIQY